MPQVFGCPNCQNPFQVPDDSAGQTFQCPSCQSTIEVPALDGNGSSGVQSPAPDPDVFQCPHCSGQFGIDASMYGENLSCPHCENVVAIGEAASEETIAGPEIVTKPNFQEVTENATSESQPDTETKSSTGEQNDAAVASHPSEVPVAAFTEDNAPPESEEPTEPIAEPVFEPQPVDHLLPPRFAVPDPVRFPARLGSNEVILPDGEGGYQAVDANVVTITHNGEVYHLKRLSPEARRKRAFIHNLIAIAVAVLLIYLTFKTLGVLG